VGEKGQGETCSFLSSGGGGEGRQLAGNRCRLYWLAAAGKAGAGGGVCGLDKSVYYLKEMPIDGHKFT
jgi:hypothetical protein